MDVTITPEGVTFDLLFPEGRVMVDLLADMEAQGFGPTIIRMRSGGPPTAPPALVDLHALTPAQYRTLEAAHRIGYFAPGSGVSVGDLARVVGCSRSTVHEHLQKAMQNLLDAVLVGPDAQRSDSGRNGTARLRSRRPVPARSTG